jgi:hypothetical protein
MKCAVQVAKFSLLLLICGQIFSCNKNDPPPPDPVDPKGDSTNADTISNHLLFSKATKITGTIPKGPAGSSLKISFEDTIFLADKWKIPVKFLHEDTTKNLAGIYVQVHIGASGGTFYYDVPEVPDIATNDTVSYILIGIDTDGLIDTARFEITIVPYDPNGQPLGEVTRPVQILTPTANPTGECGLITKVGEYWNWSMSSIPNPEDPTGEDIFFNSPNKLWGLTGQFIQGCCTNGISAYTPNCLDINKRSLVFQTFFNWPNELYKFIEDGTYAGLTEFISADPDPEASNFCGSAAGVVREDFDRSFLEGTWTISPSLFLTTLGTSTPQAGSLAARPDGRIDLVSCRLLIVTQPDREGTNRDLVKFYTRQNSSSPEWHPL